MKNNILLFFAVIVLLAVGSVKTFNIEAQSQHLFPDAASEQSTPIDNLISSQDKKFRQSSNSVANRYIVVLKKAEDFARPIESEKVALELAGRYSGQIDKFYSSAVSGFSIEMSEKAAKEMSLDESVKYIEEDAEMHISAVQSSAPWGLDRIDQKNIPLNGTYNYTQTGTGVHAYIIDTGIRASHQEFGGRAVASFDAVNDGQNGNDCNGHGTHVAGTVGGSTYGAAKNVSLHGVRVMECSGSGYLSNVIAGIDWVTANHISPAVANLSIGASGIASSLDEAINNSIASGVTYVVAAGNSNLNACNYSPSNVPAAITVGAVNSLDIKSSFSNYGSCVDVFAPGQGIISSWTTNDTATASLSGTSMAAPHVTGVAALFLETNPTAAPQTVAAALTAAAASTAVSNAGAGSPNLIIQSYFTPNGGGNVCSGTSYAGTISAGAANYHSSIEGFSGISGSYKAELIATGENQITFSLEKKKGTKWIPYRTPPTQASTQLIDAAGKAGTFRWKVYSISGGGSSYTLCTNIP